MTNSRILLVVVSQLILIAALFWPHKTPDETPIEAHMGFGAIGIPVPKGCSLLNFEYDATAKMFVASCEVTREDRIEIEHLTLFSMPTR